jgi:CheY-like chemotaxis protein
MSSNASNQEQAEEKPVKVLLAEDDKDDQEIFQDALNETGINTKLEVVENGQELIDTLKDTSTPDPDIVFVDINMPVKDGQQAVAEIKADPALKDIPTVMLSTSDNPNGIKQSFQAGADLYIQKPNSFRNFVLILKKIFSFHWAGQVLRTAWERFFFSEKHLPHKGE